LSIVNNDFHTSFYLYYYIENILHCRDTISNKLIQLILQKAHTHTHTHFNDDDIPLRKHRCGIQSYRVSDY
jgi:hypothetical protein